MLINASKSTHFICAAALSLGFSMPVAAAPQIGVTAALRGEVVRTASLESGAAIGQMSSGQTVFLGDDIKVGAQGRLQVMLLDETIFTLGANAVMRIDEFVYDPNDTSRSSLSTSIKQGAFRFVSGQIARSGRDAMAVTLPGATIGVRGTSVAGNVAPNGAASVILLGPAPNNNLGLPAGAINVANAAGAVDITRPGFATQIDAAGQAPAAPVQATPAQIRNLERALSEDAASELADGLGVSVAAIEVNEGTDSDGDGQLDTYTANAELSAAILAATGSEGGVTNDAALVEKVADTLFGGDNIAGLSDEERSDMFRGINLGEGIGELLAGDFEYLGSTTISDLADFGPNGRITFTGADATITDLNGDNAGTFSLTQVWDLANDDVSSTLGGTFNLSDGRGNVISGTFDETATQVMDISNASGAAMVQFTNSFSATPPFDGNPASLNDADVFGQVGGSTYDREGNLQIAGQTSMFQAPGMQARDGFVTEPRLSEFVTLDASSRQVMLDTASSAGTYQFEVRVDSFLSNVDRKDGTSPIASVGEGGVNLRLMENDMSSGDMVVLNKGDGSIFAMKRSVEEASE